jgi:hypothetical protein
MKVVFRVVCPEDMDTLRHVFRNYNETDGRQIGYYSFEDLQKRSSCLCNDARRDMTDDPTVIPRVMCRYMRGEKLPEYGDMYIHGNGKLISLEVGDMVNKMRIHDWFDSFCPFVRVYDDIPKEAVFTAFFTMKSLRRYSLQYDRPPTPGKNSATHNKVVVTV